MRQPENARFKASGRSLERWFERWGYGCTRLLLVKVVRWHAFCTTARIRLVYWHAFCIIMHGLGQAQFLQGGCNYRASSALVRFLQGRGRHESCKALIWHDLCMRGPILSQI